MSSSTVLLDVSNELRRQIVAALETTPDTTSGSPGTNITLEPPGGQTGSEIASLYLYHIEIDPNLRNQAFLPDRNRDDLFRRPPLPLKLRYLFTPIADEDQNQIVLGRVLQHFHDFSSFDAISGDAFGGASPELRVKPDLLSLEQLSQLWNAFSQPYRLALSLLVDVVALDSGQPPSRHGRVHEVLTATGQVV